MRYWYKSSFLDIDPVGMHMRPADVREIAAFGHTPWEALEAGLYESDLCYTLMTPDEQPAAMLGVVRCELHLGMGRVWLLGTPLIEQYGYRFLRHSKEVLKLLEADYEGLYNYAHADNEVHLKWLKWLGFKFLRKVTINNEPFVEFVKLKG